MYVASVIYHFASNFRADLVPDSLVLEKTFAICKMDLSS
jgi:hypothetical protein